ncbi:MAG: UDP-N-acetylmuramoyl-L-alanine--D-glutamate ligase [Candidatus Saccharibacteria bacterium]|nr:UDP-N-acetylmuramoyl-L-alanine--D-glutamate ligase [Candidatus Saccharibacteria bacterium]
MNIAILGFAGQGQSAYEYWNQGDNKLTICDRSTKTKVPKGTKSQLGKDYLKNLDKFDLLVRTPALHPSDIQKANPKHPDILDKVTTVTNEFFKICPSRNIIGVTGTKGKGTTSTLIAKMLDAAGIRVHLGGNIGIPPLALLKDGIRPGDWVVLELANFQLIDLKHSPHIGVVLMIVEEHLDWHVSMEEYVTAKQQMFAHQKPRDVAIYFAENDTSKAVASVGRAKKLPYYDPPGAYVKDNNIIIDERPICSINDIKLLGKHNLQNVCAAITTVWQVHQDANAIRWALQTFSGLEHRLELVKEIDKVSYYDDSFGTTPETAIVAMEAFTEPKVVILGGSDKGARYDKLALTVKNHNVRKVVLIGDTAPDIKKALKAVDFTDIVDDGKTMKSIVKTAHKYAKPGDVVLLSTGCASFGMFSDYKDRGQQFKDEVLKLA